MYVTPHLTAAVRLLHGLLARAGHGRAARWRRVAAVAVLAAIGITAASPVHAQEPGDSRAAPRVAVEDDLSGPMPSVLLAAPPLPVAVAVRVAAAVRPALPVLDERLAAYRQRGIPIWLAVPAPAILDEVAAWRGALAGLVAKHGDGLVLVEIVVDATDPKVAAFAVRTAATDTRAARSSIRIVLGGTAVRSQPEGTDPIPAELAPYVDLLAVPAGADAARVASALEARHPTMSVVVTGRQTGAERNEARDEARDEAIVQMLDSQLETLGTAVVLQAWLPSEALEPAIRALAPLATLMTGEVSALDPGAATLRLTVEGRDATASVKHRLLFDGRTFATFLAYWSDASPDPLQAALTLPVEGVPAVYGLSSGTRLQAAGYSRDQQTGQVRVSVPRPGGAVLVDFNEGAAEVFVERSGVSAERPLTVDEIIARHQQQQRAQDALVRSYIASARMSQHFRPTMTDPGYDVVTENRYFVADDGIEWEELSFSVNGSKWGSDRPPFPLLQPEKVLSLPLQLRFDADYRYRLAGTGRAGGHDCYVVDFEPANPAGSSLYRGTLWIERRTFARVQVRAVQTGLSAPVVSNEETQTYAAVTAIGNRPVFLFTGLDARQIMLIAGRNLLVEKQVEFRDFRVNDDGFAEARVAARRSDNVMYRETDGGLRYYVKDGDARVVSERATRSVRAMAMGVTLDPSYAFPLPIFGINYLNFELNRRTDTQLAVLFAGVLAAGNVQRSRIGGTPFDASVDFFAIAVPSTDRLYDGAGERDEERLLTWPLTTGLNLGWQYTPFQKLTGQYQFRFDGFARERTTLESYRVPASTVTNGFGAAWEYKRGGYSFVTNGTWFTRAGWRAFGPEAGGETAEPGAAGPGPAEPRYVKYSASLSRDFFFNVFHKIHLNAAWFGGRDLDRFAKYQFGMFDDTRIHGVPASGVRFGELGVLRGSYSFNIFEQYRLDLFLEQAWGRDRAFDDLWQPITGIGTAVNFRAPWNTILRADVGKSFLPERYRGIGSATLQVMLLKPLK